MNVLITGSKGFIGRNLVKILKDNSQMSVMEFDKENTLEDLHGFVSKANAVFHFAAVVRPSSIDGYEENISITNCLLGYLKETGNKCPVMFASSIQAELDNPYGQSKRDEEQIIINYGIENNVNAYVFRFPNLFGKMCRPNYTSVVATFCFNTVKGLPITINNPATMMRFVYIEDVLKDICKIVFAQKKENANKINNITDYYSVGLGELGYYMETLKTNKNPLINRSDDFYNKLRDTYLWYLSCYGE